MRALLVCAAPVSGYGDHIAGLAELTDLVIAVDGGGGLCSESGVTPDLVVGDLDSLDPRVLDEFVSRAVPVRAYPTDKDETDLEIAIREARDLGATEVVVTAATTGRLDHTLGTLAALASASDLMPSIAEKDLSGWLLSPEGRRTVTVDGVGSLLSIVAFGAPARVSARGVGWPLEYADIIPATTLGVSNVVEDAAGATVIVHWGCAFVLSARDERPPAVLVP